MKGRQLLPAGVARSRCGQRRPGCRTESGALRALRRSPAARAPGAAAGLAPGAAGRASTDGGLPGGRGPV